MTVLQRKALESSPLADLHAIASELGLEGFRTLRRDRLIDAILGAQEGDGGAAEAAEPSEAAEPEPEPEPAEPEPEPEPEPDEVPAEEALETPRAGDPDAEVGEEEPEVVEDEVSDEEILTGVLDILPNGSGFLRLDGDDVYVSPAQIRRCELRAGDTVSGPVRPPRRNERHPSLVRVENVNGGAAEPPEQRPQFSDLTPVFARERLDSPADGVVFGRGSRVAVSGAPGAGATKLLRELAAALRGAEIELHVALVGVRPEEVGEWRAEFGEAVSGGGFDRSPDAQVQAAELAVERAKRAVERGRHAAVVIDTLEALSPGAQRRLFGAGRATEEGGSLTVVASVGELREPLRWATTRVVLDAPESPSGTLRSERL
jgi:transcription termination factor Rho